MAGLPALTDRLPLGQTGLEVSPFCLGMVRSPAVVLHAFDAGINFFFLTADMHWPLYENLRQGLAELLARGADVRDQVVVGVVSYVTQPEFSSMPFEEVIAQLPGLERVDLAIAGGAYSRELMSRLPVYVDHRRNGRYGVRAIGSSFHDRQAAWMAINHRMIDIAYIRYNTLHQGADRDLFPRLSPSSPTLLYNFKSTLGHMPPSQYSKLVLSEDYWQTKVTDHYRFALGHPAIHGILGALGQPAHVGELVEALARGPLDDGEHQYLLDLADLQLGRASLAENQGLPEKTP